MKEKRSEIIGSHGKRAEYEKKGKEEAIHQNQKWSIKKKFTQKKELETRQDKTRQDKTRKIYKYK
jgi:hypothetical protein